MNTETMTVHEALCEIKTADSRIEKAIYELGVVGYRKASSDKVNGKPVKDFEDEEKSQFQRVQDIINRTEALKAAVSDSNARTKVTIDGKEYSVAAALYLWNSDLESRKKLLNKITTEYNTVQNYIKLENGEKLETRADNFISSMYGGSTKTDVKSESVFKARKDFIEEQQLVMVDPLNAKKVMSDMSDSIDSFLSKVDAAIQVSNATTEITINY